MSHWPTKSGRGVKPPHSFYQKTSLFGIKKESGKERESTSTNLVAILKIITPLDPRNSENSNRTVNIVV